MKIRTYKIIFIFTLAMVLTGTTRMAAAADNYLGEFCWKIVAEGEPFDDASVFKMGVYEKEGTHYALYGIYDEEQAVHGNAELVGDIISVTLLGSAYYTDEVVSETIQATLSRSTLSGPAHVLGIAVDLTTKAVQNFYVPHTMIFITCP